jgi:LysM repeat protein
MKAIPFYTVLLLPLMMVSCKSTKDSGYEDPYVSNFGTDGGYNPYPSGGGYEQPSTAYTPASAPTTPTTPTYETPPATDDYAFNAPAKPAPTTTVKPKTSSNSSSSAAKKSTTAKKKASSSGRSHTVTRGETLYGLARKYGTSVTKIKSANGLSGDMIRIGQKLKIP